MENYQILGRIGEGAHGIVLKAKHIQVRKIISERQGEVLLVQTGELVALKKVPLRKLDDGIPNSALRYIVFHKLSVSMEYGSGVVSNWFWHSLVGQPLLHQKRERFDVVGGAGPRD